MYIRQIIKFCKWYDFIRYEIIKKFLSKGFLALISESGIRITVHGSRLNLVKPS